MMAALKAAGEAPTEVLAAAVCCDAVSLPFSNGAFKSVIASEVLEHIQNDSRALAEMTRVLAPGGLLALSVPAWLPERLCWLLSSDYHAPAQVGGHVRIYRNSALREMLRDCGLTTLQTHRAHALHTPYWWLRCIVGPANDRHPLVAAYHRFLCWEIIKRPRLLRLLERLANPLLGKSLVLYAAKPLKRSNAQAVRESHSDATTAASQKRAIAGARFRSTRRGRTCDAVR